MDSFYKFSKLCHKYTPQIEKINSTYLYFNFGRLECNFFYYYTFEDIFFYNPLPLFLVFSIVVNSWMLHLGKWIPFLLLYIKIKYYKIRLS